MGGGQKDEKGKIKGWRKRVNVGERTGEEKVEQWEHTEGQRS